MAIKIHHATAKKAAKFGITLKVVENEVEASKGDRYVASEPSADKALRIAMERLGIKDRAPAEQPAKAKAAPKRISRGVRADRDDEDELEDNDENHGEGDEADAEDEADEDADEGKSVIKSKYKGRYKPFKMKCGDDMSQLVSAHVQVKKKLDGKTVMRIDQGKLKRLAQANGAWVPSYQDINVGLRRMSISNRLRKLARDKVEIKWVP